MADDRTGTPLEIRGLDEDNIIWQDLALCSRNEELPLAMFYEGYEESDSIAKIVDQACLSCQVLPQCFKTGVQDRDWGTWGAVFLNKGKVDANKNSHKTEEVWDQIISRLGYDPRPEVVNESLQ